jgi:hypothetical protein
MNYFPRTNVGGISLSRLIVGTNWFLGYSHYSKAKDKFITNTQTKENIIKILEVFMESGVDTVMGPLNQLLTDSIKEVQQRTGKEIKLILTPWFNILPGGPSENDPERIIAQCKEAGACICMPHQMVTDALMDRMYRKIRDIDRYTDMIREYEMVPGLSTHMPETVVYTDENGDDIETYIQIYNATGFLMQVETDWVMKIINNAKKPVMTIKPLAAGRLMPISGLAFSWNTIRPQDMVTIGTTTPDEAREVIGISLELLERRIPDYDLQRTRSKSSIDGLKTQNPQL